MRAGRYRKSYRGGAVVATAPARRTRMRIGQPCAFAAFTAAVNAGMISNTSPTMP
jgi:hypothetical protein